MDRTELAWAAGFWDGEGSAYLVGASDRATKQPHARVNQASAEGVPEVLTRFQHALGFGDVKGPSIQPGKEPLYRWDVSTRAEVSATFAALRPWLGRVKRAQFGTVLVISDSPTDGPDFRSRDEQIAWCAGLFDGEGSVYLAKHRSHEGYFRVEAAITQSDANGTPDVLTRFRSITSMGFAKGPYPAPPGHDPVYRWKLYRRPDVERLIESLWPWLGAVKRGQAERALAVVAVQPPLPRGNPGWGNRKTHCINGHEYATARIRPFKGRGRNTEPPRPSHQCLACVREYARSKRQKTRAAAE